MEKDPDFGLQVSGSSTVKENHEPANDIAEEVSGQHNDPRWQI